MFRNVRLKTSLRNLFLLSCAVEMFLSPFQQFREHGGRPTMVYSIMLSVWK